MQSHGGRTKQLADISRWCDEVTESAGPDRFARRPLLKAAVLGIGGETAPRSGGQTAPRSGGQAGAGARGAAGTGAYALSGTILDISPHVIVLDACHGEQRFPLTPTAQAWRGGPVPPAALRQGDHVVVRRKLPGGPAIDRIWAQAGRVTGTIIEREGPATLLVDEGPAKGRKIVMIGTAATGRIQVRFPRLEPGYLIDVMGLKHEGFLQALIPATSQPPYRADRPPAPPPVNGHVPDAISGTAVWHEPGEEPENLLGLAYPALDPETGCEHATAVPPTSAADLYAVDPHRTGPGCARLPYLSVGSLLRLRNDCTGRSRVLPVTSCGATARLFCDRCVTCGTSPKGRIADLTMVAFAELGGELETGCFNVTMTVGG
jgi:hypothetical protein